MKYLCSVQEEIDALKAQIEENDEENEERWIALLDSDPIKHVNSFRWANEMPPGWVVDGHRGPPLVEIGGIWGTDCFDGFDQNASEFFCRNLMMVSNLTVEDFREPINHDEVQELYGEYPVLLTDVQCAENAQNVDDCTSGPMGYASCSSGNDIQIGCGLWYNQPTMPPEYYNNRTI